MSVIDAKECTLVNDLNPKYQTFYDLFAEGSKTLDFNRLEKHKTYSIELVSPYNRVIIPYSEIKLYHTGTRNNITLEECNDDIGIEKPKEYSFNSLNDVIEMAKTLPFSEEGYVVVDGNWNRIKVKSPAYLAVHHLHNNGNLNKKRVLELIRTNEHHEYLSYFQEHKEFFDKIEKVYQIYLEKIKKDVEDVSSQIFLTRKDYALYVKKLTNPDLLFSMLSGKITKDDWMKYILEMKIENLVDYLKLNSIEDIKLLLNDNRTFTTYSRTIVK
jgi:hypothetical protein